MNTFPRTLAFDSVNIAAGVDPLIKDQLQAKATSHDTTLAEIVRQAADELVHPRLTDIKDSEDGGSSTLNGHIYDRELIGGLITDYQGYATDRDIDQFIIERDRARRIAMEPAHARVKLITAAQKIFRDVAYMDTDSIHATSLPWVAKALGPGGP